MDPMLTFSISSNAPTVYYSVQARVHSSAAHNSWSRLRKKAHLWSKKKRKAVEKVIGSIGASATAFSPVEVLSLGMKEKIPPQTLQSTQTH